VLNRIKSISYEGNGNGGILYVNDLALSLNSLNSLLRSLEIGTTRDDQVVLSFGGQVFRFGERRASQRGELAGAPRSEMTLRLLCGSSSKPTRQRPEREQIYDSRPVVPPNVPWP